MESAPKQWRWRNHNVHVVDGTTVILPDTDSNRKAFLKHKNYKGEVALPMARIIVILSLTVGTIIEYALGAMQGKGTGEHSLLRGILHSLTKRDVLLGDAYYPSFFLMSDLHSRGIEGVFAGSGTRHYAFRKGLSEGKNDHLVQWKRPVKPDGMKKSTLNYQTTFLSSKNYNKNELAKLYESRWQVEITFRDIKRTMNMEALSCKTAEMVKKEIGVHFLGYNLIRVLISEACVKHNALPYHVSFKGTLQLLNQLMLYNLVSTRRQVLFDELLRLIITNKIGHRAGRVEPRALKSERRNRFCTMKKPREILRNSLIQKKCRKYATS